MRFSNDQLTQLIATMGGILDGVMSAGDSGMMGRARELTAVVTYVSKAGDLFPDNPLVAQLIEQLGTGNEVSANLTRIEKDQFKNPSVLFAAIGALDEMLPRDAHGFGVRQFIYGMAETIATASGGGLFGTGTKVTAEEADFLDFLKSKLGL